MTFLLATAMAFICGIGSAASFQTGDKLSGLFLALAALVFSIGLLAVTL